jgi:metallophosphoesterase superfamily enzyme
MLMPAFGVMSGGLDLRHKAMKGLFDHASLIAHLLGRDRIYSVRFGNLASSRPPALKERRSDRPCD